MENDDCDQTSNPCKTVSSTDKSPGDRTQQCTATANGAASYHIQYYWAFKTIIIFFIKTLDERNGIFFFPISLPGQNMSHQTKVFKNFSLHLVHPEPTTLFVARTFSSILFLCGTKEPFTELPSFAAGLIQLLEEPLTHHHHHRPSHSCFLYSTFQRTIPCSSSVNDAIMGRESFRGCWAAYTIVRLDN